jgi:cation diffusion facilitator family transporter
MEISEKVAGLSILVNLLLVLIKALLASLSGSLAIKADAIHSLTDVVSSLILLIGIRISKRTSPRFPYGLYKVENLVALGISLLIFLAGYEIFMEAFTSPSRQLPGHIMLSALGIIATMLIAWAFSRYELKKGQQTGSPSLVADARDFGADMLSSLVILASLLGSAAGLALDRFAAVIVAIFVARSAFTIFIDSVRVLLDASLDPQSLEKIREIVTEDPRTVRINELRARNAGRYKFIELDLTLRVNEMLKGHQVVEEIKQRIRNGLEMVDHVQIHYEPEKKEIWTLGAPIENDKRSISEHFGEAPSFYLRRINLQQGEIIEDAVLANPYRLEEKGKGIKAAKWLIEQGVDSVVVQKDLMGRGPGFVLGNAGIEVILCKNPDLETAFAKIGENLCGAEKDPEHWNEIEKGQAKIDHLT